MPFSCIAAAIRRSRVNVLGRISAWRISEEASLAEFGKLVGMSVANLCDIDEPALQRRRVPEHEGDPGEEAIEHQELPLAREAGAACADVRRRCSRACLKAEGVE